MWKRSVLGSALFKDKITIIKKVISDFSDVRNIPIAFRSLGFAFYGRCHQKYSCDSTRVPLILFLNTAYLLFILSIQKRIMLPLLLSCPKLFLYELYVGMYNNVCNWCTLYLVSELIACLLTIAASMHYSAGHGLLLLIMLNKWFWNFHCSLV